MSIRAFLYSGGPLRPTSRHNDLLLLPSLIRTQTKARWPSAKPNTLRHLLTTSKQQQESSPGHRLFECEDGGTKRRADRKWRQVSRLLICGGGGRVGVPPGGVSSSSSSWQKHTKTKIVGEKKKKSKERKGEKGENTHSPKHFTLTINPFGTLICWTRGSTAATTHTAADVGSKLVTLFLIGLKIPPSFSLSNP